MDGEKTGSGVERTIDEKKKKVRYNALRGISPKRGKKRRALGMETTLYPCL